MSLSIGGCKVFLRMWKISFLENHQRRDSLLRNTRQIYFPTNAIKLNVLFIIVVVVVRFEIMLRFDGMRSFNRIISAILSHGRNCFDLFYPSVSIDVCFIEKPRQKSLSRKELLLFFFAYCVLMEFLLNLLVVRLFW